jgi:hypothetical protein
MNRLPSVHAYDELRLRIDAGEASAYRVLASTCCAEASGRFELPVNELEIESFILQMGCPGGRRRSGISALEQAKRLGGELFDALFRDEVRALYRDALGQARAAGRGLRITVCLSGSPELMEVPWEFLYDAPAFLAISAFTPVVRYLDLPRAPRPLLVDPPFRILGVVSNPADYERLDVDVERANLELALTGSMASGALELRWLEQPTLDALLQTLRAEAFHALHYVGHGSYDRCSEQGMLLFEDSSGWGRPVGGDELGTVLHDITSLRLAVLNACEGARTARGDPFSGIAESLVQRDIPAVIAMQSEISDEAAIAFAEGLYSAIAVGAPVDSALSAARVSMFAKRGDDIEWGTPALFMRVPDGRIFQLPDTQSGSGRAPGDSAATPSASGDRLARRREPRRLLTPAATTKQPPKRRVRPTPNVDQAGEAHAAPASRGPHRWIRLLMTGVGSVAVLIAAFVSIVAPGSSKQSGYAAAVSSLCALAGAQQHALPRSARTLETELQSASTWQQRQHYVLQATDSRINDVANLLADVDSLEPPTAAAESWRDVAANSISTTLTALDQYQLNLEGVKDQNQLVTRVAAFDRNRKQFVTHSVTTRAALAHIGGWDCLAPNPAVPVVGIGPRSTSGKSAANLARRQSSQPTKHGRRGKPLASTDVRDRPDLAVGDRLSRGTSSSGGAASGDGATPRASASPSGGRVVESDHSGSPPADGWTRGGAPTLSTRGGGDSGGRSSNPEPTTPGGSGPDAALPAVPGTEVVP